MQHTIYIYIYIYKSRAGVYEILCLGSNKKYVSETSRCIDKRIYDQRGDLKKADINIWSDVI